MRHLMFVVVLQIVLYPNLKAQNAPDSVGEKHTDDGHFHWKHMVIPAGFIGYGIASLSSQDIGQINYSTRNEINEHQPGHIRLDNYTQYLPAAMVYGFNAAGIKGEHTFKDRSIIYAASQLIVAGITVPLKHLVKEERPDSSNFLSFPSGHTATAFSSAWFMYKEYHKNHFWLSLSGIPLATFTGVYRTLNNKHWVGDVVAGAGIGILSTELSYWLFPKIGSLSHHSKHAHAAMIVPYVQDGSYGVGFVKQL
ncbi:MAG TPA: phosphatase PAP2 family protein [Chitinophagaceae bacterium]|nr:phosphatase PAP2 family protein [Chitinophagaceae bacterium]